MIPHFPVGTDPENPFLTQVAKEEDESFLDSIDFIKLIHVFTKSLLWVGVILIMCLVSGSLYLRYTPKVYESNAMLKLDIKSDAKVLGLNLVGDEGKKNVSQLLGEVELLKSKVLQEAVVKAMDLSVSYYLYGNVMNEEKYKDSPFSVVYNKEDENIIYDTPFDVHIINNKMYEIRYYDATKDEKLERKYYFGQLIKIGNFKFRLFLTNNYSNVVNGKRFYFTINSESTTYNFIATNLSTLILNQDANTLGIFCKDYNQSKAQDVVHTTLQVYQAMSLDNKRKSQDQTIQFINSQLEETSIQLGIAESKLESFLSKTGTGEPGSHFELLRDKMVDLDEQLAKLNFQNTLIDELQTKMSDSKKLETFIPNIEGLGNAQLGSALIDLNKTYKEMNLLKSTSKKSTLAYRSKELELNSLKTSIQEYIFQERKNLMKQMTTLNARLDDIRKDINVLPSNETELNRLKRFYNLYEKYYMLLIEKRVELGIAKAGTVPEFLILNPASYPTSPVSPVNSQIYMVAVFVALFISIIFISIRYLNQNIIISTKDLERLTKAPFLGVVPRYIRDKMPVSKLVVDKNPKSTISESLRSIRTNIDFLLPKKKNVLISITSTISGEGKTFVASNLSGIMAMSHKKVVLLDVDLRKPKIHQAFDLDNSKGISTILIGKNTLDECIYKTDLEFLDVIPAGPIPPNPSELILRDEFDQMVEELKTRYEVIFFDTPPVGLVTDGLLVMQKVDVPLYVIRADYTRKGIDKNINSLLKTRQFKNLSLILNSVDGTKSYSYGYGYGKGYGYTYGYGYYDKDKQNKSWFKSIKDIFIPVRRK